MKKFKLIIPAKLNYSEFIRLFAYEVSSDAGLSKRECNIVKLITDEVFINAVRYGSDENSSILIEGSYSKGRVNFAIEDEGKGKNKMTPDKLLDIVNEEFENKDPEKTHGRGLAQITSVMASEFKILDGKNGGIRIEYSKKIGEEDVSEQKKHDEKKIHKNKVHISHKEKKIFVLSGEISNNNIDEVILPIQNYMNKIAFPVLLIFECSDLDYVNTIFIGHIAHWHSRLKMFGGEIVIRNANGFVLNVIDLIGLKKLIKLENSDESI